MRNGYLYIGIGLFLLYVVQEALDVRWSYLLALQQVESYKRWSGLVLLVFIALQWSLTLVRAKKKWEHRSAAFMDIHKWMGALSPLAFYAHSMKLGYAYLMVLSITFFANVLIGFINLDVVKAKAYWYFQAWMIVHVALSLAISMIAFYHIWIVFYYQ